MVGVCSTSDSGPWILLLAHIRASSLTFCSYLASLSPRMRVPKSTTDTRPDCRLRALVWLVDGGAWGRHCGGSCRMPDAGWVCCGMGRPSEFNDVCEQLVTLILTKQQSALELASRKLLHVPTAARPVHSTQAFPVISKQRPQISAPPTNSCCKPSSFATS